MITNKRHLKLVIFGDGIFGWVGIFMMNAWKIFKLPLSALQIFTGAKSFVDNPFLGSRWLNQRGLHRSRCAIAARMAAWRRSRLVVSVDRADRKAFDATGIVVKPDFLPEEVFERLRQEVLGQSWETLEMRQGPAITRRAPLDAASLETVAPALAQLVKDQGVNNLIRYAAATRGRPVFYLQAILTGGKGEGEDPQTAAHSDTFHAAAKAWFFLHDVDPDEGPFFYVPSSHLRNQQRLDWEYEQSITAASSQNRYQARGSFRISDSDLKKIGLTTPKPMAVKANTLVVGDISGFHGRTPSPNPTTRIEIYATLRRNPFLPWLGLHSLNLPVLRGRLGSLEIGASRALRGYGFRSLWPRGGRKPMLDPE